MNSRLTFENTQNVSYSIKSSYLKNLIDVLPIQIKLPNNKDIQDLKLTEKIKIISDYVVLIKLNKITITITFINLLILNGLKIISLIIYCIILNY